MPSLIDQLLWLLILALPIACISRTFTQEGLFREMRELLLERRERSGSTTVKKFYYLFTCEYCFSHYVALFFIWLFSFHLLVADWRGYIAAFFAAVLVANVYLNIYARLRVDIRQAKAATQKIEKEVKREGAGDTHPPLSESAAAPHPEYLPN